MKVFFLMGALVVSGCSGPLACNDSDAKKQVLTVIDSHLKSANWFQEMGPDLGDREISGISTTESNKDLGRYTCSAQYRFEYKEKVREVRFGYELNYLEDKRESEVLVDVNTVRARYMTAAMGH